MFILPLIAFCVTIYIAFLITKITKYHPDMSDDLTVATQLSFALQEVASVGVWMYFLYAPEFQRNLAF